MFSVFLPLTPVLRFYILSWTGCDSPERMAQKCKTTNSIPTPSSFLLTTMLKAARSLTTATISRIANHLCAPDPVPLFTTPNASTAFPKRNYDPRFPGKSAEPAACIGEAFLEA